MKKIRMSLAVGMAVLAGMLGAFSAGNKAQAACAAAWEMGERRVSFCGGALEDGTFTAKLEGDDENGYVSTVVLKDYKGPMFLAKGYGTGFPVKKYVVELEGLNEVILEDFEQIYMGEVEYELRGEGRLVVKTATKDTTDSGVSGGSLGGSSEGSSGSSSGGSSGGSDLPDALVGPTVEQAKCSDFGAEDAVTWVAVRVGIIGGAVAVVALAAFGAVKLVREVKKGKEAGEKSGKDGDAKDSDVDKSGE